MGDEREEGVSEQCMAVHVPVWPRGYGAWAAAHGGGGSPGLMQPACLPACLPVCYTRNDNDKVKAVSTVATAGAWGGIRPQQCLILD